MGMHFSSPRSRAPVALDNKHRKPYPQLAKEVIRVSDIILEVLDARFIDETRNPMMEEIIKSKGKSIIYVINKADLVDEAEVVKSGKLRGLTPYVFISCRKPIGRKQLRDRIKIEVKRLRKENQLMLQQAQAGEIHIPGEKKEWMLKVDKRAHIGIIGYPNTGKSTLTNILTGHGAAQAAGAAGFTRGIQKVRFTKDILVLDSPGVFEEKEGNTESVDVLKKHAKIGIKTFDKAKQPDFIVAELLKEFPGVIEGYYGSSANGDVELLLEELGRKWGFLTKGNMVDVDKTARRILKDWQLGDITKKKKNIESA